MMTSTSRVILKKSVLALQKQKNGLYKLVRLNVGEYWRFYDYYKGRCRLAKKVDDETKIHKLEDVLLIPEEELAEYFYIQNEE